LNRFIDVVSTQSEYTKDGTIKAIPIIIYHRAGDNEAIDYNTDLKLFEKEMKYLHENNFRVITMKDLGYEKKTNYLYIKSLDEPPLTVGIARYQPAIDLFCILDGENGMVPAMKNDFILSIRDTVPIKHYTTSADKVALFS
jgi:hypothetical protein